MAIENIEMSIYFDCFGTWALWIDGELISLMSFPVPEPPDAEIVLEVK